MKTVKFFLLFLFSFTVQEVIAQSISINLIGPTWNVSVPTITQAGSDYSSNITSSVNQSTISLLFGLTTILTNWKVVVKKQDTNWNSNLTLWVRKTGNGTGILSPVVGTISPSGVSSFVQLSNVEQEIYRGFSTRYDVPIQYELRGLSVLVPVNNYSTSIVYTLLDL